MDAHRPDNSRSDSNPAGLSSAEYRAKLLTKLNCLVAVLEVAIAKISRSMDLPGADADRLKKIRANLENTLSICKRARRTLETNGDTGEPTAARADHDDRGDRDHHSLDAARGDRMSYRDYVELTSIDEYRKFKNLDPIGNDELANVDFDSLLDDLGKL